MGRKLGIAVAIAFAAASGLFFFLREDLPTGAGAGSRPRAEHRPSTGDGSLASSPSPTELPPAAAATVESEIDLDGGPAALRGTVLDPAGSPAPGAEVTLFVSRLPAEVEQEGGLPVLRVIRLEGGGPGAIRELAASVEIPFRPEIARGLDRLASVRADDEGRYAFTGVPSGRYLLAARAEGSLETPSPEILHVADREEEIDLPTIAAGEITGSVHGEDGSAIAGATIRARGEIVPLEAGFASMFVPRDALLLHLLNPPSGATASDADGSFRLSGLPPLEYRLYVDASPWAAAEARASVPELAPVQVVLSPGGSIEGVVLSDGGEPLAGASIALSLDEGGSTPLESLLRPLPSAISSSDGTFRLEGLAEAGYRVDAAAAGWQTGAARGLTVQAGEATAIEVVLVPGGIIEGFVRDPEGGAIADAEVEARGPRGERLAGERTDADGAFRLDTLPEGSHTLRARKDGWVAAELEAPTGGDPVALELSPGPMVSGRFLAADGSPVARVRVMVERPWEHAIVAESDADGRFSAQLSEATGIRLRARAAGYAEALFEAPDGGGDLGEIVLADAVRIEGIVLDPEGAPLPGARVAATVERGSAPLSPPAPGARAPSSAREAAAWSDAEGRFSLEVDDPLSLYRVTARYSLLLPSAAETVDPGSAASARVVLRLRHGASIEGLVLGAAMEPLDGAVIELREVRRRGGGTRRTARASEGRFRIAGLEPGTYELRASAVRHAQSLLEEIVLAADELRRVEFRLAPEQRLVGRVVDDRGAPIEGARIGVAEDGGARRSATSDAGGSFVVDRLGRGSLDVTVEAAGYLRHREQDILAEAGAIEFSLRIAHELSGLVLDQGTEEPIAGARVRIRPAAAAANDDTVREVWARTDGDGIFTLRNLDVGAYALDASADGYIPFGVPEVRLPQLPSEGDLTLLLRAGGRIRGVVHDSVGAALEQAQVRAYRIEDEAEPGKAPRRSRGRPAAQARTDEQGEFSLAGLPEGTFEVRIEHPEYLPGSETVLLALDRPEPRIAIGLERGAELEGRVYGAYGATAAAGNVVLDGPVRRRVRVASGGNYRIAGLPEGVYRLRFVPSQDAGEASGTVTVELRPRQRRTVDLTP